MLILEVRLLTGRYAAATVTDASRAEWPPHPARVYSALTAALHDEPDPPGDEVQALEWLAEAGAPEVIASEAGTRWLGSVYVPTNDQKALPDIDQHINRLTAAEEALSGAEGKERTRAEKAIEKARVALLARSVSSADADGSGTPANAAELLVRPKNDRRFPVAVPEDDLVHFQWAASPAPDLAEALDRLSARVARLGHSSSLVSMRVLAEPVEQGDRQRWVPSEHGSSFLRVPLRGQLERLRTAHSLHRQVEQRVLPADPVRYSSGPTVEAPAEVPAGVFTHRAEEWILFEVVPGSEGERRKLLNASLAQQVARALRGLLFRHLDVERSPEVLTGHRDGGAPAVLPHLAYVPLAAVGGPHSTGSILGIALVPPRDFGVRARDLLLEAIHRAELEVAGHGSGTAMTAPEPPPLRLTLGRRGVLHIRRLRDVPRRKTLLPSRWIEPSRLWYTATAIALGRNPGNLNAREPERIASAVAAAEATVAADCVNLGYPEPAAVWIHRRSLLGGAPAAHRFMPFPDQGNGPRRVCVHAEIHFDRPVLGPVILGAGRYFGLGLCAPVREPS